MLNNTVEELTNVQEWMIRMLTYHVDKQIYVASDLTAMTVVMILVTVTVTSCQQPEAEHMCTWV